MSEAQIVPPPPAPSAQERDTMYTAVSRCFVSDTVTLPTSAMRETMAAAVCGDDVFGTDEPTKRLQAAIAHLTGKEDALFLSSGTLSNQLALCLHSAPIPAAVLCNHRAHVHVHEAGGIAIHSRATTQAVVPRNGHHLTLEDVQEHVTREPDIYSPITRVVSLENSLNGTILPQEEAVRIAEYARSIGVSMHLDGARLWNVAAETGRPLHELCAPFDTVSLCLSKGIGAPVGTVLTGPHALIERARHLRKLFGSGMRQTGAITAAAHMALHENFPKLSDTHRLARYAAEQLEARGFKLLVPVETNMVGSPETRGPTDMQVFVDFAAGGIDPRQLTQRAAQLAPPMYLHGNRLVIHHQNTERAVADLLQLLDNMRGAT